GPGGPLRANGSASCETRTEEDRVDPGSEANKRPDRRDGKSQHLNSTYDIGEPDSPGPDRGKRGAMWREPLTGNMGENFESHKPVHETTTDSCTGGKATKRDFHLPPFFPE